MAYLELDEQGEALTPCRLRERGLRRARGGGILARWAPGRREEAERELRAALCDLVDAFLLERRGQVELFALAHRIGRDLALEFGCPFEYLAEEQRYEIRCPVLALHQRVAFSVAWTKITKCSICGAGAFGCDHIDGQRYDGELCTMVVERIVGPGHVALTTNPDFLHTWHQPQRVVAGELLKRGKIARLGAELRCEHCLGCPGIAGAGPGDLDPKGRFDTLAAAGRAREAVAEG
jgi:hypothetical protein